MYKLAKVVVRPKQSPPSLVKICKMYFFPRSGGGPNSTTHGLYCRMRLEQSVTYSANKCKAILLAFIRDPSGRTPKITDVSLASLGGGVHRGVVYHHQLMAYPRMRGSTCLRRSYPLNHISGLGLSQLSLWNATLCIVWVASGLLL